MKKYLIIASAATLLYACGDNQNNQKDKTQNQSTIRNTDINKVIIEKTSDGSEFPNATLLIKDYKVKNLDNSDSVEVTFNFEVQNYELKAQTPDATSRSCNNSKDGQHIHFILNNAPYTALYEPTHTVKLQKNSEHTLMTFLSRSYHLSLKNKEAHQVMKFKVDGNGNIQKLDTANEPMIFYSRPKGTYLGNDVENVLLDFYVINAEDKLKSGEYRIHANIGGKEIYITEWTPHFIKELPYGKHDIKLALVDSSNQVIGNNVINTSVTLAEKEPIQ